MYKMDKTIGKLLTHKEEEESKKFTDEVSLPERLRQAWFLTCMAYGIDPQHPPKIDKTIFSMRKHTQ